MSTPAEVADSAGDDVRRTEEVLDRSAAQDQNATTDTHPAGPLPDFNT